MTLRKGLVSPLALGLMMLVAQTSQYSDSSVETLSAAQSVSTQRVDFSAIKNAYKQHVSLVEEMKTELYSRLYSNGWNQELMDFLTESEECELPHRAFAAAERKFGATFTSLFEGCSSLVVRNSRGSFRLTKGGASAWAHMHAELVDTLLRQEYASRKMVTV